MKKDLIRFIGILIIILVFSIFVYPTPYYYSYMLDSHVIVKINRFTGETYFLNPQTKTWDGIKK